MSSWSTSIRVRAERFADLGLPVGSIIGTVVRDKDVIVPRGDDRVEGGDHLLICCTAAAVGGVRDLFAGREPRR